MRSAIVLVAIIIIAACGTSGETSDAGEGGVFVDGGVCCQRGAPGSGCGGIATGPVSVGGFTFGTGACKQKTIPACHAIHSGTDTHGCLTWIDDGPCDCDAGACEPIADVSGFSPYPMQPPHAPMPSACTHAEIIDFAACNTGQASACGTPDGSACAACLMSKSLDSAWGPLVEDVVWWNTGGCVDLVLGQTSSEPSSCGTAYDALEQCVGYACGQCSVLTTPRLSCDAEVVNESCKHYADATQAANGPCAPLFDAGAPDVSACFPDASIADPVMRQRDFIERLAAYFCGL